MTSPSSARGHPLLTAAAIDQLAEKRFEHPINPKGRRHSRALGDATGLEQIGVQLVRIAPGDETTEHHFHHFEEEFIYVLAGRGLAEIGEESHEVGPGDFMGFGPNSLAHSLSNPHEEDLVYLLGEPDRSSTSATIRVPRSACTSGEMKSTWSICRPTVRWISRNASCPLPSD